MKIRTQHGRGVVLACVVLLAGCGGSSSHGAHAGTETDNPSPTDAGKPPMYQSPGDFGDQGGGAVGCPSGPPVNKPRWLPLWGQDESLLIGASPYRGLIVVDTSDSANPKLQSETPLPGEIHQVLVQSSAQVTLAIDEVPVGARDAVLTPQALQPVPRLLRFDASDPHAVKRIADIDLEGEFWSMRLLGSTLWVMSEAVVEPVTSCNRPPYDCGYVERTALIVAGFQFSNGSWRRVARVELKSTGPAWELADGYATFEALGDEANGPPTHGVLRFVHFDGNDGLAQPGMLMVPGDVVPGSPLGLTDSLAHVFVRNNETGSAVLDTVSLGTGKLLSTVADLSQPQFDYSVFVGGRMIVDGEFGAVAARVIDFSDPAAPSSQSFPDGVTRVVPLGDGTRVLGLNQPGPKLRASLFSLGDGAPVLLDQLTVSGDDPAFDVDQVHVLGDHVLISYRSSDQMRRTVALAVTDTALQQPSSIDAGYANDILISKDAFFAADDSELRTGSLSGGSSAQLAWARETIDEIDAGAYRATLTRNDAGTGVLELTRAGKLVSSLDAGPMPVRLVADDEHVLVLSLEPRDQCEQTGLDCSHYEPNVAIVTLGEAPAIAATVELSDADALAPSVAREHVIDWNSDGDVALTLGKGRFVLVANYEATCSSEDECAKLGVKPEPANQAQIAPGGPATPPCIPGASCGPTPAPVASVFGDKRATRLYLLDASVSKPQFAAPIDSVLELGGSRFAPPRVSAGTIMVTRIERPGTLGGPTQQDEAARFMLDRFVIEDGKLHAQPPINVPGLPIALGAAGSLLFTVEPGAQMGPGKVYMLALDDGGARSLDEAPIDASYSDATAAFGKLLYLRHDAIDCDGKSTLVPFALPGDRDGELRALHTFELPGGRYRIADARDQKLLLMDDRSHYVVLDVSGDTPELVKFLSAPVGPSRPTLQGDRIFGVSYLYPNELQF
jgi:hypothetical protein